MLKASMSDYEKSSMVTYPFYFINRQSIHKTNCRQRIKKILMREVFPAIALNACYTAFRSLYRHVVCNAPVSCKTNEDKNHLVAWLDSYLIVE